jgi:hypothetical protein
MTGQLNEAKRVLKDKYVLEEATRMASQARAKFEEGEELHSSVMKEKRHLKLQMR